jgi:hypothetical protein
MIQTMKFFRFILFLLVISALLDPDGKSGSGSTDPIESGSGYTTLVLKMHEKKLKTYRFNANMQLYQAFIDQI